MRIRSRYGEAVSDFDFDGDFGRGTHTWRVALYPVALGFVPHGNVRNLSSILTLW
jgi:hypothetical protein